MKVEKVPDSTYDMIGGLDQQIKEIKEVSLQRQADLGFGIMTLLIMLLGTPTNPPSCCRPLHATVQNELLAKDDGASVFCYPPRVITEAVLSTQVIELPIKHPELFEALGVAQPKVKGIRCSILSLSVPDALCSSYTLPPMCSLAVPGPATGFQIRAGPSTDLELAVHIAKSGGSTRKWQAQAAAAIRVPGRLLIA